MAQQKLTVDNFGAIDQRVLDFLTPLNGEAAPAVNATFLGQLFIDTVAPAVYMSVAVGSETPADDWVELAQSTHTHA